MDPKNTLEYGKYLVNAASCAACHTPVDAHHQPIPGMDFAGGQSFPSPDGSPDLSKSGTLHTANITPDMESGIGAWTKKQFVATLNYYRGKEHAAAVVKQGEFNTVMPVYQYAGMTDADLGAIYDYLHSLPPVKNKVQLFTSPAP